MLLIDNDSTIIYFFILFKQHDSVIVTFYSLILEAMIFTGSQDKHDHNDCDWIVRAD